MTSVMDDPKVRARVAQLAAAAPPFTAVQRTRLAALFAGARARRAVA